MNKIKYNDPLNQVNDQEEKDYDYYGDYILLTDVKDGVPEPVVKEAKDLIEAQQKEISKELKARGRKPLSDVEWITKGPAPTESGEIVASVGWKQKWSKP